MAQQNVYFAHHKEAAMHHEHAANHREANSLYVAGKHDAASHHALIVHGQTLHALHHSKELPSSTRTPMRR